MYIEELSIPTIDRILPPTPADEGQISDEAVKNAVKEWAKGGALGVSGETFKDVYLNLMRKIDTEPIDYTNEDIDKFENILEKNRKGDLMLSSVLDIMYNINAKKDVGNQEGGRRKQEGGGPLNANDYDNNLLMIQTGGMKKRKKEGGEQLEEGEGGGESANKLGEWQKKTLNNLAEYTGEDDDDGDDDEEAEDMDEGEGSEDEDEDSLFILASEAVAQMAAENKDVTEEPQDVGVEEVVVVEPVEEPSKRQAMKRWAKVRNTIKVVFKNIYKLKARNHKSAKNIIQSNLNEETKKIDDNTNYLENALFGMKINIGNEENRYYSEGHDDPDAVRPRRGELRARVELRGRRWRSRPDARWGAVGDNNHQDISEGGSKTKRNTRKNKKQQKKKTTRRKHVKKRKNRKMKRTRRKSLKQQKKKTTRRKNLNKRKKIIKK